MHFSTLAESLAAAKNPLYRIHDELQSGGQHVVDLVRGNVNEHGIIFPPEILDEILRESAEDARTYRPDSFGQPAARGAIAAYYKSQLRMDQIVLTPGTSVSYWYCFKLLCEPGDEVLTPQPSYPLFDYIAQLCGIRLGTYRLREDRNWNVDLENLENRITTKTRAIVVISPHNPTGMVMSDMELQSLAEIAARHHLPVISDEVFNEFVFQPEPLPRVLSTTAPLVFTLNGFSKMFALPGMKVGWIGVTGEEQLVRKSLSALELISDTFLPVNEVAQFAVPRILERGSEFLAAYRNWVHRCRDTAISALSGCRFVPPQGGFYVTLSTTRDEEALASELLKERHILVHPGYFYDIPPEHLVMTFIHNPAELETAFKQIAQIAAPDW